MKRFTFLLLLAFLLASCSREINLGEQTPEPGRLPENDKLEAVIDNMYGLMDDLFGPVTRSGGTRRIASITPVGAPTRSEGAEPPAYILNFEDNGGFAVLSTDPYSDDIIAISNSGYLDPEELERARELWLEDEQFLEDEEDEEDEDDGDDDTWIDPEDFVYGDEHLPDEPLTPAPFPPEYAHSGNQTAGSDFVPDGENPAAMLIARYIETIIAIRPPEHYDPGKDRNDGDEPNDPRTAEWSPWTAREGIPPLIKTKWDQGEPYNNLCPMDGSNRSWAGCVAIALGQIGAYYQKPYGYRWNIISHYGVFRGTDFVYPPQYGPYIASYILNIGRYVNMDYSYSEGSSATIGMAKKYVKRKMGLNACRHKYSWKRVKERLCKKAPVYMRARTPNTGHAFILDGFMLQQRYDLRPGPANIQTRYLVHINWGWGGFGDGYYIQGVFDPTQRASEVDESIGDVGEAIGTDRYTQNFRTITWQQVTVPTVPTLPPLLAP